MSEIRCVTDALLPPDALPSPEAPVAPDARRRRLLSRAGLFGSPKPQQIGRFELCRHLGTGATGVAYLAHDPLLERHVAIKILHRDVSADAAGKWLLQEAKALARLSHPNIVSIHEVGTHEGQLFLAMEYAAGQTLAKWLSVGDRPAEAVLRAFAQAGHALASAHERGYVHRDFKPANVMIDENGVVKVLDFGLARALALANRASSTQPCGASAWEGAMEATGELVGTPAYMAPEQMAGHSDARSDQFSFAVALFEGLYGVRPFAGKTPDALLSSIRAGAIVEVERRKDVLEPVHAAVLRALSRDPDARWPSMADLLDALQLAMGPADMGKGASRSARLGIPLLVSGALLLAYLFARPGGGQAMDRTEHGIENATAREVEASIACPVLVATGVDEPSGWLGAAAAAMICERARVILGGKYETTLVPAELLELPREVVDDFPVDPYGAPDARARSLEAARRRARALIDGDVERIPGGFRVNLRLIGPSGKIEKSGSGLGVALHSAVRAAFAPLDAEDGIQRAHALDPEIAEWSGARTIDGALALLDATFAVVELSPEQAEEQRRLQPYLGETGASGRLWWDVFEFQLGHRVTPSASTAEIPSSGGALVHGVQLLIHTQMTTGSGAPIATLESLRRARATIASRLGQALLLSTEACLLAERDPSTATDLAMRSVRLAPRSIEGHFCGAWEELEHGGIRAGGAGRRAWHPWQADGWLVNGPEAPAFTRRALVLAPHFQPVVAAVVDLALEAGETAEARAAVADLATGGRPGEVGAALLSARIAASEASFGRALEISEAELVPRADDEGWVRTERFLVGAQALRIAAIAGQAERPTEAILGLLSGPDPLPVSCLWIHEYLAMACMRSSAGLRAPCFARLSELESRGGFANDLMGTARFVEGARLYARGDLVAAARMWSPLARSDSAYFELAPDEMSRAFEKSGQGELAERVDAEEQTRRSAFNGATPADLRLARRALGRGDAMLAVQLASRVIEAWSVGDLHVPAVDEAHVLRSIAERMLREAASPQALARQMPRSNMPRH